MGAAAAVPWALDTVTAAHFWLFESKRVTAPLRAISLLDIEEKKREYIYIRVAIFLITIRVYEFKNISQLLTHCYATLAKVELPVNQ